MRLLRQVETLESRRADERAALAERRDVSLVWTSATRRVDRELAPGEYLALDVYYSDMGPWPDRMPQRRAEERVTVDRLDLGNVYDPAGVLIGRVCAVRGQLYDWARLEDAVSTPPTPPVGMKPRRVAPRGRVRGGGAGLAGPSL